MVVVVAMINDGSESMEDDGGWEETQVRPDQIGGGEIISRWLRNHGKSRRREREVELDIAVYSEAWMAGRRRGYVRMSLVDDEQLSVNQEQQHGWKSRVSTWNPMT